MDLYFHNLLFNNNKIFKLPLSENKPISKIDGDTRVLIFINEEILEAEKILINKIMLACHIHPEQFEIRTQCYWNKIKNAEDIKEIILFGVKEKSLGLNVQFPKLCPIQFDGKIWIKAEDIKALMINDNLKNELWHKALKPYFAM